MVDEKKACLVKIMKGGQTFSSWLSMKNETCFNGNTARLYLDTNQMYALGVLNIMGMLVALLSNVAVISYVVTYLKFKSNPSMMLMLTLAFVDLSVSLITSPLNISLYFKVIANEYSCSLDISMEFFALFFGHLSAYITALIGYDRHLRMKHLNSYSDVMPMWKVFCAVSVALICSLTHAAAQIFAILEDLYNIVVLVGACVDFFLLVLMITPYVLLVRVIKRLRNDTVSNDLFHDVDHQINSIAFRIVVTVVLLYSPYVLLSSIRVLLSTNSPVKQDKTFAVMWCISHDLTFVSSFVNAIIFVSISPTFRQKMRQICIHKVSSVD